jgi:predicted DNA-binding antitoxin AbrB/MazE fold protein
MAGTIAAVYEHGVFRPTEPVDIPEGTTVTVLTVARVVENGAADPGQGAAALAEIAAMPMEPSDAAFSGREHDAILYGGGRAR